MSLQLGVSSLVVKVSKFLADGLRRLRDAKRRPFWTDVFRSNRIHFDFASRNTERAFGAKQTRRTRRFQRYFFVFRPFATP